MRIDRGLSEKLLEHALNSGASHAEVFVRLSKGLSVEVKGGETDAVESSSDFGYSLRVIKDGRPGLSYSTVPGDFLKVVDAAMETSRWAESDEFYDVTEPCTPAMPEIYDVAIEELSEKDALGMALSVERGAVDEDPRIKKVRKAEASFSKSETLIANTRGNLQNYISTYFSAHIMAVAEEGGDSQMGWDFQSHRFLSGVSFGEVGKKAARRALCMLGAGRLKPARANVVLDNTVSAEFLGIFSSLLSSDSVQKGKSLLKGKKGLRVVSPRIDMLDDGLMGGMAGSRPVDDEGFPSSKKVLVKEGVLEGFLYNTYTARKDGVRSTGNAVRPGISGPPGVGPTNLYIDSPEKTPVDGLFKKMERGLFVLEAMGVHTANPISGEFSIGVSGLWVEGGRILRPVKEAVISGNILDFMGRVEAVGDDIRFFGKIGAPSLLVVDVDVSG